MADKLFGDAGSLWGKGLTLTPSKVIIRVSKYDDHAMETVAACPDTIVHGFMGQEVCLVKELVEGLIHAQIPQMLRNMGLSEGLYKHFEIGFGRLSDGNDSPILSLQDAKSLVLLEYGEDRISFKGIRPLYLKKIPQNILREIEWIHVVGTFSFEISEIKLRQGTLGNARIAWGTASLQGREALLVASEDRSAGRKLSISLDQTSPKRATKRTTRPR
jgi:hypothetical protein